ncbi:MAG: MATE family efflux transporter [Clostridiales bacterium]|nr:MATE family efflux transporter [Clostridiales bacterium]
MLEKLKKFFGSQDMTEGMPVQKILMFAIPLLLGNVVQQMYNTVDSIVVGQYVGDNALAAVGASGPVLNLLLVLFAGISTGAGIMVSQYYGAKDKENLALSIGNTLTLTFIAGIIMMLGGIFLSRPLLELLNTPAEVLDMAAIYMRVLFSGILATAYYNIIQGILRGMGDSVMPLVFLFVACVINIILDILFVTVFKLGVMGVALATILAQVVSCILCIMRMWKIRNEIGLKVRHFKLNKHISLSIARLGLPSGIAQAIFSMASIIVQSLTNSFGATIMSCSVMIMRVDGFAMMPNFSFGMAVTTFVGQNIGAGKIKRVEEGTKQGVLLAAGVSLVLTLGIVFFGRYLLMMFTNTEEIITLATSMLRVLAVGYVAMAITQVLSGVMRGAGDTMTPMWISLITTVIIRVPLAYGIAYFTRSPELPNGTPYCLYISLLVSWLLGALITFIAYRKGKWRSKSVVRRNLSDDKAQEA